MVMLLYLISQGHSNGSHLGLSHARSEFDSIFFVCVHGTEDLSW